MGDRTYSYYDCPKCQTRSGVEIYDAPSCLLYVEACQHCDFKVDLDYYETEPNTIELLSSIEANKRRLTQKQHNSSGSDEESAVQETELGEYNEEI